MGLVFASRRTAIDISLIQRILTEDEYRQIGPEGKVFPGDVAIYRKQESRKITHVGVVLKIKSNLLGSPNITILSKWGKEGEYIHPADHVPERYGELTEFWTDRRNLP